MDIPIITPAGSINLEVAKLISTGSVNKRSPPEPVPKIVDKPLLYPNPILNYSISESINSVHLRPPSLLSKKNFVVPASQIPESKEKILNPDSRSAGPNNPPANSNNYRPPIDSTSEDTLKKSENLENNVRKVVEVVNAPTPELKIPSITKQSNQLKITSFVKLLFKNVDLELVNAKKSEFMNLKKQVSEEFPGVVIEEGSGECKICLKKFELICLKCKCVLCKVCLEEHLRNFKLPSLGMYGIEREKRKCNLCNEVIGRLDEENLIKVCNLNKFDVEKEAKLKILNNKKMIVCEFCLKEKIHFDVKSCLHACLDCQAQIIRGGENCCKVCGGKWDFESFSKIMVKCSCCQNTQRQISEICCYNIGKYLHKEKCVLCYKCSKNSALTEKCLSCSQMLTRSEKIELNSYLFYICPVCNQDTFREEIILCQNQDKIHCRKCKARNCVDCNNYLIDRSRALK